MSKQSNIDPHLVLSMDYLISSTFISKTMKRREILKYTALATGAAVSAPLAGSLLAGCNADVAVNTDDYALQFFDDQQFMLVKDLVDTILPKTDSPSATEVGVHRMIDHMVGAIYNDEYKEEYKAGFALLTNFLDGNGGFLEMDEEKKLTTLRDLDNSDDESLGDTKEAFTALKQQAVAYYLTTEEIGTKFLNYLPVPGEYESCISVEETGGKLWAI